MRRPITIKDVAKKADVSISTVSRVINNSKPVTDQVKQRVLDVIDETGYIPNPLARSLVTKKSQLIGVIVPEISDYLVNEMLNGIEEVAKMYDYEILLANTYSDKEQELKCINLLRAKQVEGIVMISNDLQEEHVEYIKKCSIPVTYMSKNANDFDIYTVSVDNEMASYDMTNYLIDLNHKKIALLLNNNEKSVLETERINGYKKALNERNIDFDENLIFMSGQNYENGYDTVKRLIEDKVEIDSIFATSDEIAIGAINASIDMGMNVPEDISVVGFDDVKMSRIYRPKLTTVHQPLYDIGAVAIRMVIKLIDVNRLDEKKVNLPHRIIERESAIKRK
ncbi:MAG: LacI family DNA-binding transcriptional regulator [Peptostreptococcaceae bacterium]